MEYDDDYTVDRLSTDEIYTLVLVVYNVLEKPMKLKRFVGFSFFIWIDPRQTVGVAAADPDHSD